MAPSSIDWRVRTHVKARKTATTGAKTTTTAVVASAAVAPQSHPLFVVILLNSNQFSPYYSTIVVGSIFTTFVRHAFLFILRVTQSVHYILVWPFSVHYIFTVTGSLQRYL